MSLPIKEFDMFLGKTVRVVVSDGRLIEGELVCMDKDLNFILNTATEYHGVKEGERHYLTPCEFPLTSFFFPFRILGIRFP